MDIPWDEAQRNIHSALELSSCIIGWQLVDLSQTFLQDSSIAYKRAVLNCIDYLHKFGYTKQQVRLPPCPTLYCCFQQMTEYPE